MKQVDRTKICWSCEADVSYEATYCPFCGTDLLTAKTELQEEQPKQDERFATQSLQESLASLYKPPYSARNRQGLGVPDEREKVAFKQVVPPKDELIHNCSLPKSQTPLSSSIAPDSKRTEEHEERGAVLPLLLLSIGINLVVLGILILVFSKGGTVCLEWSAHYWFFYFLIGLPMSYVGTRLLKRCTDVKLDEKQPSTGFEEKL